MKPNFKKNDVFFHKDAKRFFIIDSVESGKGGAWLYALFSPNEKGKAPDWKRCYEQDILSKYVPVENTSSEMVKILFGN
jgi:hypothetical protein